MSLEDDLNKLQEEHDLGMLTDEQYADAKARAIEAADAEGAVRPLTGVDKVDREWRVERRQYEQQGNDGFRYLPTKGTVVLPVVFSVIFCVIWVKIALQNHSPLVFVLAAPVMELLMIPYFISTFKKANQYNDAKSTYAARREAETVEQDHEQARRRDL